MGGLCDLFVIGDNFRFDYIVHISFSKSGIVRNLLEQRTESHKHIPLTSNNYKGYWLKRPAQNNLTPLSE